MNSKPKIVLTGGGTAGHVMPHIAMLEDYEDLAWDVHYIGSSGIEKTLMEPFGITFHTIAVGKLRRYLSRENLKDFFKVFLGVWQAYWLLKKLKPKLVFSKGGFVSVPVALGAWLQGIPVVSHESDLTPGLANRIIAPFAKKLFCSFPETLSSVSAGKSLLTGVPIRKQLFNGKRQIGLEMCGFQQSDEPVLLVMGGSLGAQRINEALLECLPELLKNYRVVHITGKDKAIDFVNSKYKAFEFLGEELAHIFAMADLIVSRAGANSIFEFLALTKPMLLIPLQQGSRGDQVHNANCFSKIGLAKVLFEKDLNSSVFLSEIRELQAVAVDMSAKQRASKLHEDAKIKIIPVLKEYFV